MNKIVVHMKNGEVAKGRTIDFSQNRASFHLNTFHDPACVEEIALENLKAIFFVKDFDGNPVHVDSVDFSKAPVAGKHVIITFDDGELFFGTSDTIHRERVGFFIYPIDPEANTTRAFVINSFIEKLDYIN